MATHRLEEDDKERASHEMMLELTEGDRLKLVHARLTIMEQVEPRPGMKKVFAILANEVAEIIDNRD